MKKRNFNKIISMILCLALVLAMMVTPSISHAATEDELITQGLVVYELHDDVEDYRVNKTYPVADTAGDYVFAGWYYQDGTAYKPYSVTGADNAITAYAKFVDAKVFGAKFQLTADTMNISKQTNIRLVTTVDSINYSSVGFNVTYNDITIPCVSNNVYEEIMVYVADDGQPLAPTVFSNASVLFATHTITDVPNSAFDNEWTIEPTWTTLDGTQVVAKASEVRTITVNEYADKIDLEEGLDFETASSMQYVSTETGEYGAVLSRVEYEESTRLAVTRNAAGYPTIHLNLGKTYEAGTTVTFWMKLDSTNNGNLKVSGYNQGQSSGQISDSYVQGGFAYEARTITLNAPCDEIRLEYYTMYNPSETLYYDNFTVVVPEVVIPALETGLSFDDESDMEYVSTETGEYGAVLSRVEYEESTRLAVTRNAAGYPTIHLNLGKTYEAGTTVTFWMKLDSTNNGNLKVSGYNQGQSSGQISDSYVQGGFAYEARTITLNAPCDEIRLEYYTMYNPSETLYYDNFLVIPNITE